MNKTTLATALLLACSLPLLGACQRSATAPAADTAATAPDAGPQTMIGQAVDKGMRKAREELERGNLGLNGGIKVRVNTHGGSVFSRGEDHGLPRAEITPQGDLLIEGKPVAIDAGQRAMLLDYRQQVIGIAEAGMVLGTQGADLAGKALAEGVSSIFQGGSRDDFERHMEAEGKKIEAQASLLCNRLPAMLDAQDKLAASLPAFKPYARMTQDDIDHCMDHDDADRPAAQARLRDEIRQDIRKSVRDTVRAAAKAAAGDS